MPVAIFCVFSYALWRYGLYCNPVSFGRRKPAVRFLEPAIVFLNIFESRSSQIRTMEGRTILFCSLAHYWPRQWFAFSFQTHKPQLFYPFDRLHALKPKNPV